MRLLDLLRELRIKTVADITEHKRNEFYTTRNFGKKTLKELEDFLVLNGLKFKK